jgi:hypothetical protein
MEEKKLKIQLGEEIRNAGGDGFDGRALLRTWKQNLGGGE